MKLLKTNGPQEEDEINLWRKMLEGNTSCYEQLVGRTYGLLFQYGCRFSSDREMLKDCIQDVFLEIWEKRNVLNPQIPPRAYLLASVRRRIHRVMQRNRVQTTDNIEKSLSDFNVEFSAEYLFIQSEQDQQLAKRITCVLNELPRRQQEAIFLRFFNDLERDEIADIMDIHPQSVSNLLQSAFRTIKMQWKIIVSLIHILAN
ncbi:RNA polymerase sigma factor [Dyadobacter sediminis]|uniref:Sigma-70 family RNA polymerase sigma factor n=1 Tax=Dyadobacter sediminis TaxID=1493691 RepID=A0A5R9KIX7_9BACT|nr:sigma-70 family RNA polymerase sigma factor [Dyadobacter sediminis]TLU96134.1 sigma-70 family RNA polymerase sigma factor [Dyadobacter sediminis]GGB79578.1 DNA-directed RNA polymerase sigma-70 factor [Dyadobacter sediminis]